MTHRPRATGFVEAHRHICSDGSIHIYSRAYEALERWQAAQNTLKRAQEAHALTRAEQDAATDALADAEGAFLDALEAHYGHLPEVIDSFNETILITPTDEGVEVRSVKHVNVSDLYAIEPPPAPADVAVAPIEVTPPVPLYAEPEAA